MQALTMHPIGVIENDGSEARIVLEPEYMPALEGLDGFSHILVLWWFSEFDNPRDRNFLTERRPYAKGPEVVGTFATRSPLRPNPVALSCSYITYIDHESSIIGLAYSDAHNGTPVVDIKPYTPSLDRVENPRVPLWCRHWPTSLEQSEFFDWEAEVKS